MSEKLLVTSLKLCLTNPSLGPKETSQKGAMAWTCCPSARAALHNVAGHRNREQVQLRLAFTTPFMEKHC